MSSRRRMTGRLLIIEHWKSLTRIISSTLWSGMA
jgi:hypothetical protein